MAANMGTAMQLMSQGPEDEYLWMDPEITLFADPFVPCTDSVEDTRDTLPLQTWALGRTNIFRVPMVGDMLGDVYLEVLVPAVQQKLGVDLAPWPAADMAGAHIATGTPHIGGLAISLDRLVAHPVAGLSLTGPDGSITWQYSWQDGVQWTVVAYASGRVESTVVSALLPSRVVQPCILSLGSTSLGQGIGRGVAVQVQGAAVVSANDVWIDRLALCLMSRVRFIVDTVQIHDHERMWYDLLDRLRMPCEKEAGMAEMLGTGASMGDSHVLYLPFKFLSCRDSRDPTPFFPLVLVPSADIRVEFDAEALATLMPGQPTVPTDSTASAQWAVRLVTHHRTLTPHERAGFQAGPYRLQYEAAQDMDGENYIIGTDGTVGFKSTVSVSLAELNWPTTYFTWVAYDLQAPLFQYASNFMARATLQFDGVQREDRDAGLYRYMHPWLHAPRCMSDGRQYLYSFALDIASRDPNGALTILNAMVNPTLQLRLSESVASTMLQIKVWASTLNWLTFDKGSVTPAFAS